MSHQQKLDLDSIRHAKTIFEIFLENFDQDTPMQYGLTLFNIAEKQAVGLEPEVLELQRQVGISQAAISRTLGALGEWSSRQKPGANLIEATIDPMDRRRRKQRLTQRGLEMLKRIAQDFQSYREN